MRTPGQTAQGEDERRPARPADQLPCPRGQIPVHRRHRVPAPARSRRLQSDQRRGAGGENLPHRAVRRIREHGPQALVPRTESGEHTAQRARVERPGQLGTEHPAHRTGTRRPLGGQRRPLPGQQRPHRARARGRSGHRGRDGHGPGQYVRQRGGTQQLRQVHGQAQLPAGTRLQPHGLREAAAQRDEGRTRGPGRQGAPVAADDVRGQVEQLLQGSRGQHGVALSVGSRAPMLAPVPRRPLEPAPHRAAVPVRQQPISKTGTLSLTAGISPKVLKSGS
jgi:hypothetical protein